MGHRADPGQADDRDQDRRRKLATLRARLQEDALALRTPADWARCLRLAALMPDEEFANILLIAAQRPAATMVRDYRQWASIGRQVRRNEKGIEVFAFPSRRKHQVKEKTEQDHPERSWRTADQIAYVWDLSQTTGPPPKVIPEGFPPPGEVPTGLLDALRWLARREGFAVEHEQGAPADGTTFWAARRIRLLPGLSEDQTAWALAHQLGHILLDHGSGLPAGTTTAGCAGIRKTEADSIAFILATRYGVTAASELAHPASWAGSDPRAQPAAVILTAGQRITAAAAHITRHTDRLLHGDDPTPPIRAPARHATLPDRPRPAPGVTVSTPETAVSRPAVAAPPTEPTAATRRILRHTRDFYLSQLPGSWAPTYLDSRSISADIATKWHIGYAPAGWTALTDHLRRLGHGDDEIEAAGVAKPSSRGTLIDRFRDRVMLPVHDEQGELAGFIGRARPGAGDGVPKYLNSPETAGYHKGSLLFGLASSRQALAQGAIPVIVEGPFDAIAVTLSDPDRHAGLAPCGTALTTRHAELLSQTADLARTGILVAFDSDPAGRKAAARAYSILRPHTRMLQSVLLNAKDPAEIVQQDGPAALRAILCHHREPLSAMVIDTHIEGCARHLGSIEGRYRAMRSTASLIAELLPEDIAAKIRQLAEGHDLEMVDDMLRPVVNPQLSRIARILPADTAFQVVRASAALEFDVCEILAEVTNATTPSARSPKGEHAPRRDPSNPRADRNLPPPVLATASFPRLSLNPRAGSNSPLLSLSSVRSAALQSPRARRAR